MSQPARRPGGLGPASGRPQKGKRKTLPCGTGPQWAPIALSTPEVFCLSSARHGPRKTLLGQMRRARIPTLVWEMRRAPLESGPESPLWSGGSVGDETSPIEKWSRTPSLYTNVDCKWKKSFFCEQDFLHARTEILRQE